VTGAPTLGDLIEVADVETVVRLDGARDRLRQLVLTGDVVESLGAVLEAANAPAGAGFFVVGPFGSGKSHFLAAVGELLADPAAATTTSWEGGLRRLAAGARPSTVVAVPLVEYRAGAALEDVVAGRAWRALGEPAPPPSDDRTASWDAVLTSARSQGRQGLVLLLDELSEFLRAKQGPALTEDLRFLQFLGEWASGRPAIVVAALQESIEEVANVSQKELARIRDRYRPSLALSMRHVEDLVHGRLVRLRPAAEPWVERAWEEMAKAYPDGHVSRERFGRCYPLHPDTLALLEGLRFLLSQQRGVVDFICRRLRDVLDRGYSQLVTPDEVFDHFRGRLQERPESARLAETVVPYFERALGDLVDDEDQVLALRTVKLLCLLAASPLERPRTAAELASMLVVRVSDIDPAANVAYLSAAVLEPIASLGAYVVAQAGPPTTYSVQLDADAALVAKSRAAQLRAELSAGDRRLVATLYALGSTPQLPLQLLGEVGLSRRELLWHNTQRAVLLGTRRVLELSADEVSALVAQARKLGAEGCLLIGEVELEEGEAAQERAAVLMAANPRLALWVPASLSTEERDAVLDLHSRSRLLEEARNEGRSELVELLERARDADAAVAREILRRVYFDGQAPGVDLPSLAGLIFDRQLPRLVDPLLSGLHPQHGAIAPRGELVGERLVRQLVDDVIGAGRIGPAAVARGQLRPLIEGYLVPLGLARIRSDGATVAPDPAKSPAVAEALRLVGVGDGEVVLTTDVARALADGPVGLSGPEAILVLNACVQSGLLEAWRGRRRHSEPFLTITATDRLSAGELVEPSVRVAVAALGPVVGPGPLEPWTAGAQRSAWDYARAWLDARREELIETRAGLERYREVPALAGSDPGPVLDDLATIGAVIDACPPSLAAPAGLRQLVAATADWEALQGAARRLGAVARFLRDELRRVEEAAAYLTHPELSIPESDPALQSLRQAARDRLGEGLQLAAQDRAGTLLAATREFRGAYAAAYQEWHDRYYAAVTAEDVERVRAAPGYRALSRLAAIKAVAVPDDRVKVDRLLAGAAPTTCRRPVNVELQWKPRCSCGLALGDALPVLDGDAVMAVAEHGVRQYLDELSAPELRGRLADAVADLQALGRSELAADLAALDRLLASPTGVEGSPDLLAPTGPAGRRGLDVMAGVDDGADPPGAVGFEDGPDLCALAGLLSDDVVSVVRDVLSGGQLIVTRDLATLREDLIGRRYPKRKLHEILAAWVDPGGELPPGGFVAVVDSSEAVPPGHGGGRGGSGRDTNGNGGAGGARASTSGVAGFLTTRFPGVASLLPSQDSADAFWLSAWWAGRPQPPTWLPVRLLLEPERLAAAADAARSDVAALAELADLDARVDANSLLGDQIAGALDLASRPATDAASVLSGERLLRHPVRLAADQLVSRMGSDWRLARLVDTERAGRQHALLSAAELAPLSHLVTAARHLDALEHAMASTPGPTLVDRLYPAHYAPVRELISRAELATAESNLVSPDALVAFRSAAERLLGAVDSDFGALADVGFPGCLRVWEIGDAVIGPLLRQHGRVGVLLVDAMRADLATPFIERVAAALPGRLVRRQWAVVPSPTRTSESMAAMHLGRPVGAGSVPGLPAPAHAPFAHLGYEAAVVVGADRDAQAAEIQRLWTSGPPISVAVATGVDERLHRTSVELAALLDEAVTGLCRRVLPGLSALPSAVPLVVLADHGFRENRRWGHGPEGRYVHGGTSLEECVIPVAVFGPV
jgi:hypothetical protein